MAITVAITGGIGSGKSVVSRILTANGYRVYDTDSRAKHIMDHDTGIKCEIARCVCADAVDADMCLNRPRISQVVFADPGKLKILNEIVHGAVKDDISRWVQRHDNERVLFIETALLYQSGIDRMVHYVWEVTAPEYVRIERVCQRNNLKAADVKARIESQKIMVDYPHSSVAEIVNDGNHSVLLQVFSLLDRLEGKRHW